LRVDKRTWQLGEDVLLRVDIRNKGKRRFPFWPEQKQQLCEIEFDGKWYRWPEPVLIDSHVWPLVPGAEFLGFTISLDERLGIPIKPGRHIVRVAFAPEGVRVVSNPVGIVIAPAQ